MKHNYLITLGVLFLALAACQKQEEMEHEPGLLTLAVTVNDSENIVTKASELPVMAFKATNAAGKQSAFREDYTVISEENPVRLSKGKHTLEIYSEDYGKLGWNLNPFYGTGEVNIQPAKMNRVEMNVGRGDHKVAVEIPEDFAELYPEFRLTAWNFLNREQLVFTYEPDENKPLEGHISDVASFPASGKLSWKLQLKSTDGMAFIYSPEPLYEENAKAGDVYRLKIGCQEGSETVADGRISINGNKVDMGIDYGKENTPSITAEFELSGNLILPEGDLTRKVLAYQAPLGLVSATVETEIEDFTAAIGGEKFDFVSATEEGLAKMEVLGIKGAAIETGSKETHKIDITEFVARLGLGSHRISFKLMDSYGKEIETVMSFEIINANYVGDFDVIQKHFFDTWLGNPSSVAGTLAKINPDGSFQGVDYKNRNNQYREEVLYPLASLASAYKNPDNAGYNNPEIKDAYCRALAYWCDANHQNTNWWVRFVSYPQALLRGVSLMVDEIREDKVLLNKVVSYFRHTYDDSINKGRIEGANGADIIYGSMIESVLMKDIGRLNMYKDKLDELLQIQTTNGILVDYLFAQHCGSGRQLYMMNYGCAYVEAILNYLEMCNGTIYQVRNVDNIHKMFINGIQWLFFNFKYDPNNNGRFISSEASSERTAKLAMRLSKLDSPYRSEMEQVYNRIKGENTLVGNKMFWRFDYMVHRRTNYMTSSRMTSTRTVGNEAGSGDDASGKDNYYSSNGVNYVFVTGKEYSGDYFSKFNYRQFPGTTAEQDNDPLPVPSWGSNGGNGRDFAGGVTDGQYGASGMILDRRNVYAHKGWFYFDDEYVCLGAGVNATGSFAVYTTVNQANLDGSAVYSKDGAAGSADGTLNGVDWVWHGNIGYFNLEKDATWMLSTSNDFFTLNVNHGIRPNAGTYRYVVRPGLASAAEAAEYQKNIPLTVLANTTTVQAVRHNGLKITEIIFYRAGTVELGGGNTITCDAPCAVLWNETSGKMSLANPKCESDNPESVSLTMKINGAETVKTFTLPQGEYAGSSVTQ